MNDVSITPKQTPIEIALGIDGNGMTTAKKLYEFLGMDKSNYSRWVKRNILENEFAEMGVDFHSSDVTSEGKGNFAEDFKLTAHFAKKLSMMQKNERGEEARDYFTHVEEKTKELVVNRSQLPVSMQVIYAMLDEQARVTLEQKRQAEQLNRIEENQKAISTAMTGGNNEDFAHWVNRCLSAIAESDNYQYIGNRQERHKAIRAESYERLNSKRPCRLKQRVEAEKGRAYQAGASSARINAINKLYVIEHDKDLRPVYEAVIREMLIAYCVEVA